PDQTIRLEAPSGVHMSVWKKSGRAALQGRRGQAERLRRAPLQHCFRLLQLFDCRDLLQWTEPGSNRRPKDFQSFALPAELSVRRNHSGSEVSFPQALLSVFGVFLCSEV